MAGTLVRLAVGEAKRIDVKPEWATGFQRVTDWRADVFAGWRRGLFYEENSTFGENLELAVRGGAVVALFAVPRIWGLAAEEGTFFYHNKFFDIGSITLFVYTVYQSVGITYSFALQGFVATLLAALTSFAMYAVFPNGTSGEEWGSASTIFGVAFGTSVVIVVYLLNFPLIFHQFFVSWFTWFWMAFMDEKAPLRVAINTEEKFDTSKVQLNATVEKLDVFGLFLITDWGGFALEGTIQMMIAAVLAVVATMLPYPILSMEKAADGAANLVGALAETWHHVVEFYLAEEMNDMLKVSLQRDMVKVKADLRIEDAHLDGGWWERFFLRLCFGQRHRLLLKLEATAAHCCERLALVVDSCDRVRFEEAHYNLMQRDRCAEAVRSLAGAANELLQYVARVAEHGVLEEDEEEWLLAQGDTVLETEQELSLKVRASIEEVISEESRKQGRDMREEVSRLLVDQEVFFFSLCDFGKSVRIYSHWFIEHANKLRIDEDEVSYVKGIFDPEVIFSPERLNFTVRCSVSVLSSFAVGYVGYHKMIMPRNASIASGASLLVTHSMVAPLPHSIQRVQGSVLGLFAGQIAFSLLGYCDPWYQLALTLVVFLYLSGCLFVYYSGSSLSYVGMLAAAFGTQAFLQGCNDDEYEEAGKYANSISDLIIAVGILTFTDVVFSMGRPSDKAFKAYVKAWEALKEGLACLMMPGDDVPEAFTLKGLIAKSEALAEQAAEEPRFWRMPFEKQLFDDMILAAKVLRTQVICIEQVIMENVSLKGVERASEEDSDASDEELEGAGVVSGQKAKKAWFRRAMSQTSSIWSQQRDEVLKDMDETLEMVKVLQANNAGRKRGAQLDGDAMTGESVARMLGASMLTSGYAELSMASESSWTLVDDERAQKNFLCSSLRTILEVNSNLRLQIVKNSQVSIC